MVVVIMMNACSTDVADAGVLIAPWPRPGSI